MGFWTRLVAWLGIRLGTWLALVGVRELGPAWIDPIWGWPGYDYNAYPAGYGPDSSYDGNYSSSTRPENYQSNDVVAAPVDGGYSASSPPDAKVVMPTLLYMKDGSVFAASDFWVEDRKLHYVLSTGAEKMVDLELVDVKRTISENVDLGTQVTFKPRP